MTFFGESSLNACAAAGFIPLSRCSDRMQIGRAEVEANENQLHAGRITVLLSPRRGSHVLKSHFRVASTMKSPIRKKTEANNGHKLEQVREKPM